MDFSVAQAIFNVIAINVASLYFLSQYACVRDDECVETVTIKALDLSLPFFQVRFCARSNYYEWEYEIPSSLLPAGMLIVIWCCMSSLW